MNIVVSVSELAAGCRHSAVLLVLGSFRQFARSTAVLMLIWKHWHCVKNSQTTINISSAQRQTVGFLPNARMWSEAINPGFFCYYLNAKENTIHSY